MAKNAKNKMTVGPSETAEASAASPNNAPELNIPASGWQFDPLPKFSPQWWQERFLDGVFMQDALYGPNVQNRESWIVKWAFGSEVHTLTGGYYPTPFPTATDVLLWLRIQVLPQLVGHPKSAATAEELISRIDTAPARTDAAALLNGLKPMLLQLFPQIEITLICPIHEWLSEQGTESQFRKYYGTESISCKDGQWSMPQSIWDRIVDDLTDNEFEGLSVGRDVDEDMSS